MAGGEWRLGTASIYMGASYRSPPLRQAKSTQLHGYNSRPTKQIRQRYRPLNRAERGKLRLELSGRKSVDEDDIESRPVWDENFASELIGKLVLVGLTHCKSDSSVDRQEQFFGIV